MTTKFRALVESILAYLTESPEPDIDQKNLFIDTDGKRHTWLKSGSQSAGNGHFGYSQLNLGHLSSNVNDEPVPFGNSGWDDAAGKSTYRAAFHFGSDYLSILKHGWVRITSHGNHSVTIDCPNLEGSTLDRIYDWSNWCTLPTTTLCGLYVLGTFAMELSIKQIRAYNFEEMTT